MAGADGGLHRLQNAGLASAVGAGNLVEAFRGEFQFLDAENVGDLDVGDFHVE
ncbi:hypothetical protein D3C81_1961250 [compost metagenome]